MSSTSSFGRAGDRVRVGQRAGRVGRLERALGLPAVLPARARSRPPARRCSGAAAASAASRIVRLGWCASCRCFISLRSSWGLRFRTRKNPSQGGVAALTVSCRGQRGSVRSSPVRMNRLRYRTGGLAMLGRSGRAYSRTAGPPRGGRRPPRAATRRRVHLLVGLAEQRLQRPGVPGREHRAAGADATGQTRPRTVRAAGRCRAPAARARGAPCPAGTDDAELVTAPARHHVGRPGDLAQRLGDRDDHLVAGRVAERGVDRFSPEMSTKMQCTASPWRRASSTICAPIIASPRRLARPVSWSRTAAASAAFAAPRGRARQRAEVVDHEREPRRADHGDDVVRPGSDGPITKAARPTPPSR